MKNVIIWGNHSSTMYPDAHFAQIGDQPVSDSIDEDWLKTDFIQNVQKRGAEIINATGKSSSASAAAAACDHMHDWWLGSAGKYVSMGVIPETSFYGIDQNLCFSYPCELENGEWKIVENLKLNDFQMEKIKISEEELKSERDVAFGGE